MKPNLSYDVYDKYEERSVWFYYCLSVRKFLQNNKNCIILIITAAISVIISFICIHIDNNREYLPSVSEAYVRERSFSGQDRYAAREIIDGKINIAAADADTLDELYGIGEVLSERIILQREKEPFYTIEDIMKVSGIGWEKFEKIKNKITLGKE